MVIWNVCVSIFPIKLAENKIDVALRSYLSSTACVSNSYQIYLISIVVLSKLKLMEV